MSHPQRQSSAKRNPEKTTNESSISSSFHKTNISTVVEDHFHAHQASSTNNKPSKSSFNSKFITSLSHQLDCENNGIIPFPCIFNLSLRRWSGFKLSFCRESMDASGDVSSVHVPSETKKKKKHNEQQKREELEREVAMLQKMLNHEERVHEILERAHRQKNGAAPRIPNSLPPKMKELLAELALVEDEILRLEGQVSQLKIGLKRERELTKETKSRQWHGTSGNSQVHSVVSPKENFPIFTNKAQERVAFDTKALHFISKAIKGDFPLDDFSPKNGNKKDISDQTENQLEDEAAFQPIAVPRKSAVLIHRLTIPPLRDSRHPTPAPRRDRELNVSFNLPPKALPLSAEAEENNPKWQQPNKLSESIMKCLIFIFVRILRTSRAMELEKSGPVSRSIHSSFSSRSFRIDSNLNSKASLMMQRDLRQQDPYGIFDVEESVPRDIGPYKNLVIFSTNSMDPKFLSSSSFNPLLRTLSGLLWNLQKADLKLLSHQQKLAFWINMYNACIMHGYLQYGVPSSPEKLLMLMNKATLNVGGNVINAQAIEHFILRKPAHYIDKEKDANDDKEATVRQLYGLETFDPNITFALCCGTRSSPSVRIFTAENVVTELEKSKLEYLQASVLVTTRRTIGFPELLLRNMSDFAEDKDLLVRWVCHQLPTSGTLRKSMVECFRGHSSGKLSAIVDKIPYDFEFQYLLANISSP